MLTLAADLPMKRTNATQPAVFLDRDGTLNTEVEFLSRVEEFRLLPGVPPAIARLREAGYAAVVASNQSVVARGLLSEAGLEDVHREMERQLARGGAELDGVYYCPHHPEFGGPPYRQDCCCRKPKPGLLRRAAEEHGLDLEASFMVGDSLRDLQAGWHAGCRSILVLTGYGEDTRRQLEVSPPGQGVTVARDLADAVIHILGSAG